MRIGQPSQRARRGEPLADAVQSSTSHHQQARSSGLRSVVAFFALAYAISWAWAIALAVTGQVVERGDPWPTHYPSLLGPAVAAFVVTALTTGRRGVRDLVGRMARWRVSPRWWLVAVSPAFFLAATLAGLAILDQDLPPVSDFGLFSGTPAIGVVGVFLMITFVGALGEETGWRGYALPQLQQRLRPLTATLVLALLWFTWHVPQFWVIATYRDFAPVGFVTMLVGLTAGAVVLTWLYNRSGGSVLLVIVWHGVYNFVGATQASVTAPAVSASVWTFITLHGVLLVVLELRARRRGLPSVIGPRPNAVVA